MQKITQTRNVFFFEIKCHQDEWQIFRGTILFKTFFAEPSFEQYFCLAFVLTVLCSNSFAIFSVLNWMSLQRCVARNHY